MKKQYLIPTVRKKFFTFVLCTAGILLPWGTRKGFCQNIGINDVGALPNSKAMLDVDVSSNNMGILIPRLTTAQRTSIAGLGAVDEGLTVYDETTNSYWLWDGSAWVQFTMGNSVTSSCGSTNYIPKMTSASTIGCSQVYDDGTNVGVGTAGPGYKLHVLGDIYANGGWFRVSGTQGLYWESYGPGWYVLDGTWLRTYNNASIWANTGVIATNGSFSSGYGGTAGPAGGAIIAGTVGIGTSSPGYAVHVYSSTAIGGTSLNTTTHYGTSGVALAGNNLSGSNAYNAIEGYTVGTYSGTWGSHNVGSGTGYGTMGLTASGDGIGVYGQYPGGAGWAVWGQGWAGGTTSWWNASDERLKKNIELIPNALNMILSLRGVQYEFKVDEYKDLVLEQGVQTGFIAQEVEKVLPNAVLEKNVPRIQTTKPNSPVDINQYKLKVLSYSSIIPVLVEGMKEQQAIIDENKKQLEKQQKLMDEMRKDLDELKKK